MTQGGLITRWTYQRHRKVDLQTDVFRVDKMLADLAHYAATIPFHDEEGTPNGNWDQVLGNDQSFALALLATAEIPNRAALLREALAQAKTAEPAQAGARITALVEAMLHLARDLDEWLAPAQTGGAMEPRWAHSRAEAALEQVLGPQLQRLFDQVAEAEENRLTARWGHQGWWDQDAQPWRNTVREGEARGIARAVERAWAQRLIRELADAARQFLKDLTAASQRAEEALEDQLRTGAHDGHAALIIAFAQVFRHARGELDALPDRVLDYWLTQLRAEPAPAQGDQVLLAVLPRPGARPEVPAGLLIPAGKDAVFVADAALTVTAATLAEFRIWARDGLSVSRAVLDKDGVIRDPVVEPTLPTTMLTSASLALPGGTRRVRVRLVCEAPTPVPSGVVVAVSSADGWVDAEVHWAREGNTLLMTLLLPDTFPALAPCPGMDEPALRLTANSYVELQLSEPVRIDVAVQNAQGLTVSTPTGLASASGTAPFGTPPQIGGWLRIDHSTLTGAPLDRLVVRFNWAGVPAWDTGFAGHYRGYVVDAQGLLIDQNPFDNAAFTVTLKAPVPGWDPGRQLPLFAPAAWASAPPKAAAQTPNVFSDSFDEAPPLSPEEGPLAPSSWLAAAGSKGTVDADHVLITLTSPPQAFGHSLYAANVQWATQAMTRTQVYEPRLGLIRRVLRALLRLPKTIGSKLSGRQSTRPDPVEDTPAVLMPNPPFQPILSNIAIDYAVTALDAAAFRVPPFENAEAIATGSLFPAPSTGAAFDLIVDDAEPGSTLPLLWQLGSAGSAPEWWYRSIDGWAQLPVLEDGTAGLSTSGILRVLVPADRALDKLLMRARFAGAVPQVQGIFLHAFSATRQTTTAVVEPLPPATIAKLPGLAGVAAVTQPLSSMGGAAREAPEHVRARMVERVRHGGRAQTSCDYERLVLAGFPQVQRVRAVTTENRVSVIAEVPARLCTMIAAWLAERASPFAQIAVITPEPVPVDISAELISNGDTSQLDAAVRAFVESALALDDAAGTETIRAEILRFLISRPEVASIERLRVSLGEGVGIWRVPMAGTISIAVIESAARW